MSETTKGTGEARAHRLRLGAWSTGVILLLLPLIAMQVTDQVDWALADFVVFGALLGGAGLAYELAVRMTGDTTYRVAAGIALASAFLLAWISLGVGVIGKDGDPANLMYIGVLAVGVIGAAVARLRPAGMAKTLFATAAAQLLVAAIALGTAWSGPLEILVLNGLFAGMFLGSAMLFRKVARGESVKDAV